MKHCDVVSIFGKLEVGTALVRIFFYGNNTTGSCCQYWRPGRDIEVDSKVIMCLVTELPSKALRDSNGQIGFYRQQVNIRTIMFCIETTSLVIIPKVIVPAFAAINRRYDCQRIFATVYYKSRLPY